MPYIYTKKMELTEAELFGQLNESRRGATVTPESRVSLTQAYQAEQVKRAEQAEQELAEPQSFASLVARSQSEHPLDLAHLLPPTSKYRPTKETLVNPPTQQS